MRRSAKPLTEWQRETGRARAETQLAEPHAWGYPAVTWDEELGVPTPVTKGPNVLWCAGTVRDTGMPCGMRAGHLTAHPGVGNCFRHGGGVERATGAWMMAHLIARQLDVSPWEALLLTVKRAAAWSQFYETKLAECTDDEELRPGGAFHDWVVAYERVTDKLARYSKMAVDAGVAAMLVARARTEGETIARVLNQAIGAAGLDEDTEQRLRTALRAALLEVDTDDRAEASLTAGTIEPDGEVA